jgi:hypothetical protein
VAKLGELPLAIAQAAAYILTTSSDFVRYLGKLEANIMIVLNSPAGGLHGNVFSCWKLSFDSLTSNSAQLLRLCAFLSNENIPEELFFGGRRHWNG